MHRRPLQTPLSHVNKDNIEECEHVPEMIRELSCGINCFRLITDILACISTIKLTIFNIKLMQINAYTIHI